MKTEVALLKVLRTSPDVSQLLERHFDFVSLPGPAALSFFQLCEKIINELVGRDKSDGKFVPSRTASLYDCAFAQLM
jgi:hypothetical protein